MKKPRILLYDIETSPNLAYVWGKYDQNVLSFKKESELLCFAYKWFGEQTVHCVTRKGRSSDKSLVSKLHDLFKEADILIAHNGDQFDQKRVKARMLYHGFRPPKVLSSVDTMKVAKNYFSFNGNSLADLGSYLKLGRKAKNPGFDMWLGCINGDPGSWKRMVRYNIQDVRLLEKVYRKFLPWIENHPNLSKLVNHRTIGGTCPMSSDHTVSKNGLRATGRAVLQRWDCMTCGKHFLSRIQRSESK